MAMIFDIGLPAEDVRAISDYMQKGDGAPLPPLEGDSALVLEALTEPRDPNSTWRTVIGRFVAYEPIRTGFRTPTGEVLKHADVLYEGGEPTDLRGDVVADFQEPNGAYLVGAPL